MPIVLPGWLPRLRRLGADNWTWGWEATRRDGQLHHSSSRARFLVCYFHFVGWDCLSLGAHVALGQPNVEIHLPFGFVRIGFQVRSIP